MSKKRHLGPPVYLSTALTLGIEVTVGNGGGSYTTTGVNAGYKQIPAGYYAFGDFVTYVSQQLRQYLFDDFAAAGSLPTNSGTVDSKDLTLDFTASTTYNANLIDFHLRDAKALIGGNPANITACKLKAGWPHLLGLGQEGQDVNCTIASQQATALGQFQPRGIYTMLRSEIFGGVQARSPNGSLLMLSDGDIDAYDFDTEELPVEYTLVDQDFHITGSPVHLGTLDSISGDRLSLYFANPKRSGRVTGIFETGLQTDRVVVGQYVWVQGSGSGLGYVSRVKAITANTPATKHQIDLWEALPTLSVVTPSPVWKVSEMWAARRDARVRTGRRFLMYDADDQTGDARHTALEFMLGPEDGGIEGFTEQQTRRDVGLDRWSIKLAGYAKRKSSLTLLTT